MKDETKWIIIAIIFTISACLNVFKLGLDIGKDSCVEISK